MGDVEQKRIAIVGLGYVGLPLAVEFGKKRTTVGFDLDPERIKDLRLFDDKTLEVDKQELRKADKLRFSSDISDLRDNEIYIITVPTPIDEVNRPDLSFITRATEMIGQVLAPGDLVIYESTVYPGCTEEICVPILERVSKLKFNQDFSCGYSPERVNPGDKVNTLTQIVKITSGSNDVAARMVDEIYSDIIEAGTFLAKSIQVAEAAKVIENTQRDLNIALTNELSVIFQRIGIDTIDVLEAAGSKWNFLPFRPGLVGGHCIGVDPYYLTHKAESLGYHPQVILAGRKINDSMAAYVAKNLVRLMLRNSIDTTSATVGIMGVTFKENCPDIRNSRIVDVIKELESWNIKVVVADPWADPLEVEESYGIKLGQVDHTHQVDSLVVAVGHDEYRSLSAKSLRDCCCGEKPVLADVKSLYDEKSLVAHNFSVFRL
ncbi:nucleotide sugar dehydrogenase [Pseudomonadales bacterium]|nr:nucleotide sugar dehydrogenase [Pseudomonadales bacterium]